MNRRKVPDCLDVAFIHQVGNLLCGKVRYGDNPDFDVFLPAEFRKLVNAVNHLSRNLLTKVPVVKGGNDVKSVIPEAAVAHKGFTELACADKNGFFDLTVA